VASERFQSSDSIGGIGVAPPTPQSNDKESTGSPSQASPPHVEFNSPYESGDDEEGSLNPDERRMLEVRLLHHFTTVVSYSFPSSTTSSIRDMWNIEAVRYGFTYEFLLNAIFAISALHIVRDISESPRFFPDFYADSFRVRNHVLSTAKPTLGNVSPAKVHRFYLNLAVRQQRQAVMCLSAENTNAIILSSVLISYQGMKLHPEEDELQDYIPPVQWLYMTNAITQYVPTSDISPIITLALWRRFSFRLNRRMPPGGISVQEDDEIDDGAVRLADDSCKKEEILY